MSLEGRGVVVTGGGRGIGRAVARRLADAQGLRIKLRSELGRGTTAFVTIPETLVRRSAPQDSATATEISVIDPAELQKKTG